jgi:aspartyl-tRNA(Asn)/glutamyl-tRNA(Gln) amidotransferase subunit C
MSIEPKIALAMANLARLELTLGIPPEKEPEELSKIAEEFGKIVSYMDILGEVDTTDVEPLYSPMVEPQSPRVDSPRDPEETRAKAEDILSAAPEVFGRFFAVPRIF